MARPMLGGVELQQVQQLQVDADQVLIQHGVPALEGDLFQGLGRRATQITLTGVLTGPEAGEGLKTLRDKFHAAEPVPFVADLTTATRVDQVLIEEMGVRDLAGKPERFEYALTLREYAPTPEVKVPPEIETPENPAERIDERLGTLVVEVIVEGQPSFDYDRITVTVRGTQEDGTDLTRTLTNRTEDNVWTEDVFPAGAYTVEAVETNPEPMSGSAQVSVQAGQQARVTITLRPGAVIANAFVVHFGFDRSFIHPCMRAVLRQVAEYASTHPDEKLVIVGHTDKVGDDPPQPPLYNQSLSERRGRSVFAYLTFGRDRAGALAEWDQLRRRRTGGRRSIQDTWGPRQYQYMLQDLGYYPGNVDGDHGPLTDAAVRAFQRDKGLVVDGDVGDQTWPVLIETYLDQDALAVPESQFLPNCSGEILKWLGCGEQDPVRNTRDAWRPNRRTELLFVRADALPCEVPQPDTFDLPTSGAVGSGWCLGPGDPGARCCLITRQTGVQNKWLVQPAEPGTITVQGSIRFEDGTPLANAQYVLIAPDGEFMDGERPRGDRRGRPIPGRTDANGVFAYPDKPKGIGVYTLEIDGPYIARLESEPVEAAKGNVVCKRRDGSSDLDAIVSSREEGDPRRKLRVIIHDHFGELRRQTQVEVRFNDGGVVTAVTDDEGKFTVDMTVPYETAKIHYQVSGSDPSDVVYYANFFIDVKDINTEEGIRRRLHNLGFLNGDDLPGALTAFQATYGLDTTGEVDDETRDKLVAVHDGDDSLLPEFDFTEEPLSPNVLTEEGPPI